MNNNRFTNEALALRANIKKRHLQQKLRKEMQQLPETTTIIVNSIAYSPSDSLVIQGKNPLKGEIIISGAKNSALPLIFASILTNKPVILHNVPHLSDIHTSNSILQDLNAKINFANNTLTIDSSNINKFTTNEHNVSLMRASVLVLGPLLAKYKYAKIALPGGCLIGKRPVDIHLECIKQLGAKITEIDNFVVAEAPNGLTGTTINMQKQSVGATENTIMAAVLAKGITTIINPAQEPEIIDLANMLKQMGAKIKGEGTNTIIIEGVTSLNGVEHTVCPDRIEAGSYAIAAAITQGELILKQVDIKSIANIIAPLQQINCEVTILENNSIKVKGNAKIKPLDIETGPYPYFATDLQPQWTTLMTCASGACNINETIFENRLGYIKELNKMGANIKIVNPHLAIVNGPSHLKGTIVTPTDLRASFALILAGLIAEETTTINKLDFLDRGYENIVEKLTKCGANITRINNN